MNVCTLLFYLFYLPVTVFITARVGWLCYTYGEYYIKEIYNKQPHLVKPLNKLLLTGYYLLNIGYIVIVLSRSTPISTVAELISTLSLYMAIIILTLGLMHYFNLFALAFFSQFITKEPNHKPLKH